MTLDYDLIESICDFRYNNNNGTLGNPIRVNLRDAQLDNDGNIIATFKVGISPHLTDMFIDKGEYRRKMREKKLKSLGI